MFVHPYMRATNLPFLLLDAAVPWARHILDSILSIKELLCNKPSLFEIEVAMHLAAIWKNLLDNGYQPEHDTVEVQKDRRMKQMLNWIHEHYKEKIFLEDIAKAGQLSRSECCRYFKRILDTTPLNYVADYRFQKSAVLLKQTDVSVTEAAYQTGFSSTSYFIGKFKQSMGMTPLQYKKSCE